MLQVRGCLTQPLPFRAGFDAGPAADYVVHVADASS